MPVTCFGQNTPEMSNSGSRFSHVFTALFVTAGAPLTLLNVPNIEKRQTEKYVTRSFNHKLALDSLLSIL